MGSLDEFMRQPWAPIALIVVIVIIVIIVKIIIYSRKNNKK